MRVAIVGTDLLTQNTALRLEKEGVSVTKIEASPESVRQQCVSANYDLFLALDDNDETNLVLSALVKQLGPIKTVAAIKKAPYLFQRELDIQRAFHVDHLIYPDLLVVDKITQFIFDEGLYSRSFLHGNVLLRTMQVTRGCPFAGKTLAELREKHKEMLVCLIHRPHKIVASKEGQQIFGTGDELVFAHGRDLLLADDEITMLGETKAVLEACKQLTGAKKAVHSVCIVGSGPIGQALVEILKKHDIDVRLEQHTVPAEELATTDVFIACHSDEEHNFVVAVQAKDHGVAKVIAVLSDKATCEEAEKMGILQVSSAPTSALDKLLELVEGAKVTSVMSLYDARAEILQVSVGVDSPIVGIPLSVLGPTLPKEILIGVIYTRGRIFIAGGTHILKPQDECLIIASPAHRALLEKML